jgi:hypothetical protein
MDRSNTAGREIHNVALLDLTGANSATALEGVSRISQVAAILVPESLVARLSSIPMDRVAATVPVPDGRPVRVLTGQITMSGEALAGQEAHAQDTLVVSGQLILTSPVGRVGRDLIVLGQVVAPTGSETGLGTGLSRLTGEVAYYPYVDGARVVVMPGGAMGGDALANSFGQPTDILLVTGPLVLTSPPDSIGYQHVVALGSVLMPRGHEASVVSRIMPLGGRVIPYDAAPQIFEGKDRLSAGYFELLEAPITLIVPGKLWIEDDVSPELLRQKVSGLVLEGKLYAPRRLHPVLQVVSLVRQGKLLSLDEDEDE